jgi:hypothetical protein
MPRQRLDIKRVTAGCNGCNGAKLSDYSIRTLRSSSDFPQRLVVNFTTAGRLEVIRFGRMSFVTIRAPRGEKYAAWAADPGEVAAVNAAPFRTRATGR